MKTSKARYTHGPGIDEPLAVQKGYSWEYFCYHADGLGSIVAMTTALGLKVKTYSYDAFGRITESGFGGGDNSYTFTAREYDGETGLYYYRARYYDPKAGRFISKDPIGFEGGDVNLYAYVGNNPVNWVDPWGLKAKCYFYLILDRMSCHQRAFLQREDCRKLFSPDYRECMRKLEAWIPICLKRADENFERCMKECERK